MSLKLFLPITKVDAAQRLVYGVATAEAEDRAGEICDYASTKPYYEKWSGEIAKSTDGKSLGNVRAMHGAVAAGKVTQLNFNDDDKQIEVCVKVVDDAEWKKVEEGVYTGFSQGGTYVKRWKDDETGLQRYTADPSEISLVDLPCLPIATFDVIKADGIVEKRHFKNVIAEPTAGEVAAKATELAKAAGAGAKWSDYIAEARDVLIKAASAAATDNEDGGGNENGGDDAKYTVNSTNSQGNKAPESKHSTKADADKEAADRKSKGHTDVKVAAAEKAAPAGDLVPDSNEVVQGWRAKDGTFHAKKADALAHNARIEAEAAAKAAAAPVLAQIEEMNSALGLGKKDYSDDERKKMAESGEAKSDGSYPIKTAADVSNAVNDFNRSNGSASDKKHIIDRAKAIGATDKLPADWEGSTKKDDKSDKVMIVHGGDVKKGLPTVVRLACVIEDLKWIHDAVLVEEGDEGDADSELPAKAKASLETLCDLLTTMVNEETAELLQGQDDDALYDPLVVDYVVCDYGYWCAGPKDALDALVKTLKKGDVRARVKKVLAKVGARNSKADLDKIQAVHDHAVDLGATCDADNCGDDADKGAKAGDLAKALGELTKITAERDALQKTLTETIVPQLAEIKKKVDVIAAQPVPLPLQGRAVNKAGVDDAEPDLLEQLSKMSDEARTLLLIKAAQQNPKALGLTR